MLTTFSGPKQIIEPSSVELTLLAVTPCSETRITEPVVGDFKVSSLSALEEELAVGTTTYDTVKNETYVRR